MKYPICPRLEAYLRSWFATSTNKQAKEGVTVTLTFSEFLDLFEKRQLISLQKRIDENSIRYFMAEGNSYAYVLTWKSYAACSTRVLSKDTAAITSRMKSAQINLPQQGDELRESHKENIAKALTGVPKTDEHRKNISESCKGVKKGPMDEAGKLARSVAQKAYWDRKRAEKSAQLEGANSRD